jgi:hypothetical protein
MPYWNSSLDASAPQDSAVLSANRFGGNGTGSRQIVTNGAFANWQADYPQAHALTRRYDGGTMINPFATVDVINAIIAKSTTFDQLRGALESDPWVGPHLGIGGDMATMAASNDPLCWVHRAYIDSLWAQWQLQHGHSYGGHNPDGSLATINDALPAYGGVKVSNTMDTAKFVDATGQPTGYSYTPPKWPYLPADSKE